MPNQTNSIIKRTHVTSADRHQDSIDAVAAHDKALQEAANPEAVPEVEPTHNWEKRYKDLQSFNSRKINELNQRLEQAEKAVVQPLSVPKSPEELAAMREQDPEGYARIESIASAIAQQQLSTYDAQLATVTKDLTQSRIDSAEALIMKAHPDFKEIVANDAFHQWAEVQAPDVQDWIYNNPDQPSLSIRALTLYKADIGLGTKTNTQVAQNTQAQGGDMDVKVRTSTQTPDAVDRNHPTYIWSESEISRMRPAEFGKWNEAITLAQSEGRVAYGH